MEGTIGEIRYFTGNFEPKDWLFCEGQLININSNLALYAILGNIYGGDGKTTFALPDLRMRVAIGVGQGNGTSYYQQGVPSGEATHLLTKNEMPQHTHNARTMGSTNGPSETSPINNYLAKSVRGSSLPNIYAPVSAGNLAAMADSATNIGSAGGGLPHNNMQPYLVCNYIICQYGLYPSRQ